jgi:hypothetical protein
LFAPHALAVLVVMGMGIPRATGLSRGSSKSERPLPPPPLLLPVDGPERRLAQAALSHRLGARGLLEEEDLLLHLGREQEQVHELRDAGCYGSV